MSAHEREEFGAGLDARAVALGLLEGAPDAILVVRADGTIGLANRMAEKMFGYDRAELVGSRIEMLVPPAMRDAHAILRARFAESGTTRAMGQMAAVDGIRKDGSSVPVEIGLSPIETEAGPVTIAIVRDVTIRRRLEADLRYASTHDALTGLFNRTHLDSIRASLEKSGERVGVLMIDIDGLKAVNDRLGHSAGDELIGRCAVVLRSACPPTAAVARLGGDEFAVLLPRATNAEVHANEDRIRVELARHNEVVGGPRLVLSLGSSLADGGRGIADAMRLADERMYDDKRSHRSTPPR